MEPDHLGMRIVAAHWLDFSIFFCILCFLGGFCGLPVIGILILSAVAGMFASVFIDACLYAICGGVLSEWLWGVKLANNSDGNSFAAYVLARLHLNNSQIQYITHKHSGLKDFVGVLLWMFIIIIFFI